MKLGQSINNADMRLPTKMLDGAFTTVIVDFQSNFDKQCSHKFDIRLQAAPL